MLLPLLVVLQLKEDLGLLDDPHIAAAEYLIPTVGQQEDRDVRP